MQAGEILRLSAGRSPAVTAVIGGDTVWTYAELDRRADRVAAALAGLGLAKGARIAVLSRNLPDYAALYFGAARAGLVLVNLSARTTRQELARLLRRSTAKCLFYDPALAEAAGAAEAGCRPIAFGRPFAELLREAPAAVPAVTVRPDDPLCITFTGGTTGTPKGVVVSHRNRCEIAAAIAAEFGLSAGESVCVSTPLFHIAGLFVWFQPAVAAGCSSVLLETWDAGAFFAAVERHAISATLMVPTQLHDMLHHADFSPERLRTLRRVVYAGAPVPPALLDGLIETLPWVEFIENYGQSEIGPCTVRRGADLPAKAGSIGRAIRGVELAVLRPDGRPAEPGEVGELASRGPHVFQEYLDQPELTAELYKFGDGWLATGDLAVIDRHGFFTLVERLKDMIVSGGENIYPAEIEAALASHPAVSECAVFGIPDPRLGEVPAAHVVARDGGAIAADELIAFCADKIARFKRPRRIELVAALPRTAVGKVQKAVLRAPYWRDGQRRV